MLFLLTAGYMTTNKTRSYFDLLTGKKGNGNPMFGIIALKNMPVSTGNDKAKDQFIQK